MYERAGKKKGIDLLDHHDSNRFDAYDDITHPIPDLTGYNTEGQIILSRDSTERVLTLPISILPFHYHVLKDKGIGEGAL